MDRRTDCKTSICILLIHFILALTSSTHCDARRSMLMLRGFREPISETIKGTKKWKLTKHFNLASLVLQKETMDPSNTNPYVSSPFSLPPYDSLSPMPLPENNPPFCIYPPNTPQTPSTTIPTPIGYTPSQPPPSSSYLPPIPGPPTSPGGEVPSPPESIPTPNPPAIVPTPFGYIPTPPETVPSPPSIIYSPPYYEPSPPSYVPNPPTYVPSPTGFVPSPTIFLPPVVYPPPAVPPPPNVHPSSPLWCVAKPSVPEPIIEEAMNYACGSGADCNSIQSGGSCFEPNTVYAHASYVFNSFWQRSKAAGGTCSFGGAAILVTVDPSHDGCHFIYV